MKSRSLFSDVSMKWLAVCAGVVCLSAATLASAEEMARPCRDDAAKLCKDIKPGGGKIVHCLKQHEGELSAACKAQMDRPRGRK